MTPAEILGRHGLPSDHLEELSGGTVNRAWRTRSFVLRVGVADHAREARLAQAARARGMRTARPVAWCEGYSIWERLRGACASDFDSLPIGTWEALLDDLERLHAWPPEPRPATTPDQWRGKVGLVERTQEGAGWTQGERVALRRLLGQRLPIGNPFFIHGDAYAGNVMVDEFGAYLALVDWGCAGWGSLEGECARLEEDALELARRRWANRLDSALVERIRLDLFLEVASLGRLPFDRVRAQLDRAELTA
jgi:aminoglycoside phosphotransferase (APT) family kinase protein